MSWENYFLFCLCLLPAEYPSIRPTPCRACSRRLRRLRLNPGLVHLRIKRIGLFLLARGLAVSGGFLYLNLRNKRGVPTTGTGLNSSGLFYFGEFGRISCCNSNKSIVLSRGDLEAVKTIPPRISPRRNAHCISNQPYGNGFRKLCTK